MYITELHKIKPSAIYFKESFFQAKKHGTKMHLFKF